MLVFRKQIDNLKTNHRGVYVLTDNSFRPFARMSTEAGGQAVVRAQPVCFVIHSGLAERGEGRVEKEDYIGEEKAGSGERVGRRQILGTVSGHNGVEF